MLCDILSASQFPIHEMGLKPMFFNLSVTEDEWFPGMNLSLFRPPRSLLLLLLLESWEEPVGARGMALPGCLKMPKFSDFLWGWILHEIVCSELTFTQRTR